MPSNNQPACQHFGDCGGCTLQDLHEDDYCRHKQAIAERVAQKSHLSPEVLHPLIRVNPSSRRRVQFAVTVHKHQIKLGFHRYHSHDITDVQHCAVAVDAINHIIPLLKTTLSAMQKPSCIKDIAVTALPDGLDIVLHLATPFKTQDSQLWQAFAASHCLRLCTTDSAGVVSRLYQRQPAILPVAEVNVELPANAFLQASSEAADYMAALVCRHLSSCQNVADIYAGCGAYSFALALHPHRQIHAYEGSPDMVAAMHNAINAHQLHKRITAEMRDIYKNPIPATRLNHLDGAVLNPPRNGALPQVKQIAVSTLPRLVMVSCNPSTFIRDTAALLDAGFTLTSLNPIDQFVWSGHLEIVGCFERSSQPRNPVATT